MTGARNSMSAEHLAGSVKEALDRFSGYVRAEAEGLRRT